MDEIKFSIITPWLPERPLLSRAIQCVDSQIYKNWQHIIIVDNPDYSLPDFDHPNRKVINCPVFHKAFGNPCRTLGLAHAESEWILYLDDDDLLRPECLKVVADAIEKQPQLNWGYFAIMRLDWYFLVEPENIQVGSITGGQIFHKRHIGGELIKWTDKPDDCGDWELIERSLLKAGKPIVITSVLGDLPEYHHGELF